MLASDTSRTDNFGVPSPSAPLFPCLKPSDWALADGTVRRRLCDTPMSQPGPWLAFGYDHPQVFEFLRPDQLAELHTNAHEVETQAIANLRMRPAAWEATTVNVDGFEHLSLLVCSDDFLAAERILDADFMRQAQTTLRASALLVGIPRRGVLMATRADDDGRLVLAFALVVKEQFGKAESAPVSPQLFVVKGGAIAAMLDDMTDVTVERVNDAPAAIPDAKADESQRDDEDAPSISTIVVRNDRGLEDVHLLAGGPNGARLAKAIETAFRDVIVEHLARSEFSGHVQIVVLAMTPRSERKYIPPLLEMLRETCSTLSAHGARCRVSLTYQTSSLPAPAPPVATARKAPATTAAPSPVRATPARASGRSTTRNWLLAAIAAILIAVAGFRWYSTHDSFPDSIVYGTRRMNKATGWTRDGISGAVFVGDSEYLPTATVQIGVMTSSRRPTADALDAWIRDEYAKSPADKLYDSGPGTETCKVGVSNWDNYGYTRTFVAVQVCKTGNGRAVCAEDDEPIGQAVFKCGILTESCFQGICDVRRRNDRGALITLVDNVLAQ